MKTKMKTNKFFGLIVLLVFALFVSACGGTDQQVGVLPQGTPPPDTGAVAATETPTVPMDVQGAVEATLTAMAPVATPTPTVSVGEAISATLAALAPTATLTVTVVVTLMATEVLTTTVPEPPADRWGWSDAQVFDLSANGCDPHTYLWWTPRGNDEGFKDTGGHVDAYDIVLHDGERLIAYGSGVSVNGVDYGRSVVFADAPGRFAVVINDGAYRIGVDDPAMGLFPEYYAQVVRCLYGGDFPVKQAPNSESGPTATPTPTPHS